MSSHAKFQALFTGLTRTFYTFNKANGRNTFIDRPITSEDYQNHLKGKRAITVVPIREDGTCLFAAIDVDEYEGNNPHKTGTPIAHAKLYQALKQSNLPYYMFTSKSGGAHLYRFFSESEPVPAAIVREILKADLEPLGLNSKLELFPKQKSLKDEDKGTGINLPYFGDSRKYWYGGREVEFDVFIDIMRMKEIFEGAPPCIVGMIREGIDDNRNMTLSHMTTYLKKKYPGDEWKARLLYINSKQDRPLPVEEIESTIFKSYSENDYQYNCDTYRERPDCDMTDCRNLEHGITDRPLIDRLNRKSRLALQDYDSRLEKEHKVIPIEPEVVVAPTIPVIEPTKDKPEETKVEPPKDPYADIEHSSALPIQIQLILPDNESCNLLFSNDVLLNNFTTDSLDTYSTISKTYYKLTGALPSEMTQKEWLKNYNNLCANRTVKVLSTGNTEFDVFRERCYSDIMNALNSATDEPINDRIRSGNSILAADISNGVVTVKATAEYFQDLLESIKLMSYRFTLFSKWRIGMGWKVTRIPRCTKRIYIFKFDGGDNFKPAEGPEVTASTKINKENEERKQKSDAFETPKGVEF